MVEIVAPGLATTPAAAGLAMQGAIGQVAPSAATKARLAALQPAALPVPHPVAQWAMARAEIARERKVARKVVARIVRSLAGSQIR